MDGPLTPEVGTPVALRFTKYDGSPHWEFDVHVLGVDGYGVWVGGRPGDLCRRPGRVIDSEAYWATLIPHDGDWVATFNAPGGSLGSGIYVDVTSTPTWASTVLHGRPALLMTCADLDLDVVLKFDGQCYIDDEDEFAAHQVSFGYPPDLVSRTEDTAARVLAAVRAAQEPFGQVGASWLGRCRELLPGRSLS